MPRLGGHPAHQDLFQGKPCIYLEEVFDKLLELRGRFPGTAVRAALQESRRGIHFAVLREKGGGDCKGCFKKRELPEPSVKFTEKKKYIVETGSFVPLCKLVKRVNFA